MDPLTQGLLGAGLAQSFAKKSKVRLAAICGALGGMAPDLDVLISSKTDPLLAIEFHRHFTHSLVFIPIGGLLVGLALWLVFFRKQSFQLVYLFTTLGWATHGLLDACTSYGTRLFWPFSDERIAWSTVSIIDPVVTLTLLVFVILSIQKQSSKLAIAGMYFFLLYMSYGYHKHMQVENIVHQIAQSRGHEANRVLLNPTIGNNILWRTVYEYDGDYYIDAVRVGVMSDPEYRKGASVPVLKLDKLLSHLGADSMMAKDIERFSYFSQNYVYMHPEYDNVIADLRYGTMPYDIKSMWGIEINQSDANQHAQWKLMRNFTEEHYKEFWQMLTKAGNERFIKLPK